MVQGRFAGFLVSVWKYSICRFTSFSLNWWSLFKSKPVDVEENGNFVLGVLFSIM